MAELTVEKVYQIGLDALLAEMRLRCADCIEGGCRLAKSTPRQWCDACLADAVIAAVRGDGPLNA